MYVYAVLFEVCVKITSDFQKLREHNNISAASQKKRRSPQVSAWVWVGVDTRISVLSDQRAFG